MPAMPAPPPPARLLVPGNPERPPAPPGPPAQRRRVDAEDDVMDNAQPEAEPEEEEAAAAPPAAAAVPPNPATAYEAYLIDRVQTNELRDYNVARLTQVLRTINELFPQGRRLPVTGTRRAMLVRIRTYVRDRGWVPPDFVPDDPAALPPERQLRGLG